MGRRQVHTAQIVKRVQLDTLKTIIKCTHNVGGSKRVSR